MTLGHRCWVAAVPAAAAIMLLAVLGGCGGGGDTSDGQLRVLLTDAPAADIAEIHVHITAIRAMLSGIGEVTLLEDADMSDDIELIALAQNPLLLGQPLISPGQYTQVRLVLSETPGANWILTAESETHDLTVPSGGESGAKLLTGAFDVLAGGVVTLLLDFDAQASVHEAGASGNWIMRPTIFASVVSVPVPDLGSVDGIVLDGSDNPIVPPTDCVLGVFIETAFGPIAVAEVSTEDGAFAIPSVLAGEYELKLYYADLDWNPEGDALTFQADGGQAADTAIVTVAADETLTLALVVP